MSEKIIVNVASYNRMESLVKSVGSIIDQCDILNVVLNSYEDVIPEILYNEKINLLFSDNSLGDAMKFYMVDKSDGYFLTIDDDLIYPPNYVQYMVDKCKEYGNTKVITLHGRSFDKYPISSYYQNPSQRYSFNSFLKKQVPVQFGGTGVMCFHTDLIKFNIEYFKTANMADIWVGKYCIENDIEILCVRHESNYVQYIHQITSIYDQEHSSDTIQTKIVNNIFNPSYQEELNLSEMIVEHSKIERTIEKSQKTLNYDMINKIFSNQNQSTPKMNNPTQTQQTRPLGNVHILNKIIGKKRDR
jgi:hypothetical protein